MHSIKVPYKDFKGNPRNDVLHFNLTVPEVFKLLVEFKAIFSWRESMQDQAPRELPTEEVIEFYNHLEKILLDAYGIPSDDGLMFRKGTKYDFEESAAFPAVMTMFLSDPKEALALIDGLLPDDLQELVEKADANLAELAKDPSTGDAMQEELVRLRAELAATKAAPPTPPSA